jgi:hypothetical protein
VCEFSGSAPRRHFRIAQRMHHEDGRATRWPALTAALFFLSNLTSNFQSSSHLSTLTFVSTDRPIEALSGTDGTLVEDRRASSASVPSSQTLTYSPGRASVHRGISRGLSTLSPEEAMFESSPSRGKPTTRPTYRFVGNARHCSSESNPSGTKSRFVSSRLSSSKRMNDPGWREVCGFLVCAGGSTGWESTRCGSVRGGPRNVVRTLASRGIYGP